MIPKADVKVIGLKRISQRCFSVAGYNKLGYYPAHKLRTYKEYARALKYSLELQDYYQAPVQEY